MGQFAGTLFILGLVAIGIGLHGSTRILRSPINISGTLTAVDLSSLSDFHAVAERQALAEPFTPSNKWVAVTHAGLAAVGSGLVIASAMRL